MRKTSGYAIWKQSNIRNWRSNRAGPKEAAEKGETMITKHESLQEQAAETRTLLEDCYPAERWEIIKLKDNIRRKEDD